MVHELTEAVESRDLIATGTINNMRRPKIYNTSGDGWIEFIGISSLIPRPIITRFLSWSVIPFYRPILVSGRYKYFDIFIR